ncbi:MFS transporter [Streptomyces hundungensis]|uniref:MFS transporter n=1 Tax=Streptomyces hundungensis TaxID=1077946 RepID=UPI00340D682B
MVGNRPLGRRFGWLWASYAVSAYGSGLGFGALPLVAVLALHAGPAEVSALAAVGPAVGALIAVPLAPWVEFRRKRPVMIMMDLVRFAAMATIPVAYALGWLGFVHLLVVSAVVAAAKIAFNAASGAYLKAIVPPDDLLVANARFESTNWSSIAVGPPLGGAAIGLLGPVTTVLADALSYLLSALALTAIGGGAPTAGGGGAVGAGALSAGARARGGEGAVGAGGLPAGASAAGGKGPAPAGGLLDGASAVRGKDPGPVGGLLDGASAVGGKGRAPAGGRGPVRAGALLDGWRHILGHPVLRPLYLNNLLVSGLIMATEPLLAVLLIRQLGFPPWQYGLAFAAPCLGGLIGSRLARRVVARFGRPWVFRTVGTLRAVWLIGLVFVGPGVAGLVTVMVVELAIIINMSLYTPVLATYRLEQTPEHLVARTLTAWSIGQQTSIAVLTALAGLLADATGPRAALAVAGLLILTTPLLLPRRGRVVWSERELFRGAS